jgi:hypothetical protein
MDSEIVARRGDIFVVRLAGSSARLAGLIQHVRTGEKRRFESLEALGLAIQEMGRSDDPTACATPPESTGTPP